MKRNNCWAAVLAIWTVLSISRNGLAREQLLVNYRNAKLRTNDGEGAYEANLPTSNVENNDESNVDTELENEASNLTERASTERKFGILNNFAKTNDQSQQSRDSSANRIETTTATSSIDSLKEFGVGDANQFEGSTEANGESSKSTSKESNFRCEPTNRDPRERSNKFRGGKNRERAAERWLEGEVLDGIRASRKIEIFRERRLSPWISRGTIKNFSRSKNDVIHRDKEVTYVAPEAKSRKSETSSVKATNQWEKRGKSFALRNAGGKYVETSLSADEAVLGIDAERANAIKLTRSRNSEGDQSARSSRVEISSFHRPNSDKGATFSRNKLVHESIRYFEFFKVFKLLKFFKFLTRKNTWLSNVERASTRWELILEKLAGHRSKNFPVSSVVRLGADGIVEKEISSYEKKWSKEESGLVEDKLDAETKKVGSKIDKSIEPLQVATTAETLDTLDKDTTWINEEAPQRKITDARSKYDENTSRQSEDKSGGKQSDFAEYGENLELIYEDREDARERITRRSRIHKRAISYNATQRTDDSPRSSIMKAKNSTYPKREFNRPVLETEVDDETEGKNASFPLRNFRVASPSDSNEKELAKNPKMKRIGTSDAKAVQELPSSVEEDSKKFKIAGKQKPRENPLKRTNSREQGANESIDKTVVSLKNEAEGVRVNAEKRTSALLADRKESISLMKPSNGIHGNRLPGNYEGTKVATKFDEKLNDPPTNVPVIASGGASRISSWRGRKSLNQNKASRQSNADKTEDNESTVEFSSENAETKGVEGSAQGGQVAANERISDDSGGTNRLNPKEGETKSLGEASYGQSNNPLQVPRTFVEAELPDEFLHFRKGRNSRSSMKGLTTETYSTLEYNSSSALPGETDLASDNGQRDNRTTSFFSSLSSVDSRPPQTARNQLDTTRAPSTLVRSATSYSAGADQENHPEENHAWEEAASTSNDSLKPSLNLTGNFSLADPNEMLLASRVSTSSSLDSTTDNSTHGLDLLNQWPVKHSAVVEGDLVLGGLMMVHEREDTITCGPVMPQGGVQALEAMLYTLDIVNARDTVPGVKIGAHILDDCDKDTYGLEMAVDFIKGSISNIDGGEYHCNKTAIRKVISGVVGAASSVTSIQVANLLRLFRIPQVSFFSTSPELSNKQRFEYFTRTIPSDHYQVKAMVEIVLKMGWSYVSIIYEESNYGIKAFEELEELLGKHDICIAVKEKLVKDSGVAEETAYDNIVLKLLTKPRARGCIIFGSDQEVAGVMRAVRRCNATGAFSWIGSDGWSARGLVSNGNEPEVEGTLSVQPQANPVEGFEEYFLNLTVENNRRNPWFVEFWEDHFQCRYPNASRTPYNEKYTKPCTTKERLTKMDTAFEDQLQFVSDAVMAFAFAFRDMHSELCRGKRGLCDAMKPTKGTELLKYLRNVEFAGLSGDKFRFDKNGDGPARYNIIHFKQTEPGKYKWVRVGKYLEGVLWLNMSDIQFKLGHPQPPESVCSLPCEVGQAKKYVEGERCCWHCFNCTQYQIRHPSDETQCIPCRQGTVPDETHSTCRDIPEEFLRPESGWAIGAMSFSATGISITLFVCGVFLKHNNTPVVRASGRESSYVLLSGILLCYLVTFALVIRPTDIVCGIQRFAAGFCFTVVYAALLTKTNRISRIFNAGNHTAKRPSFISPRSQLIICSGLVFVQILINGVWMIIDPARAMHHYPTREDNLLVCNSYVDASYMIAFAYPIMLIVVCTVYAVLTRKIPEAFNESKHIGFTMYTTCVIWLAFVPLYFGTGNNVALRITSMSVTISLSASVTIACLFSPKLYIILIRPERNVRQSMMPARYGTTKSSAVTATNASSMMAPVTLTAATCDQNKTVNKHIVTTNDCSTQSEYYELEVKDKKNGKPPSSVISRSTQTSETLENEKDLNAITASNKDTKESTATTKQLNNNARIGNGPVNQTDVSL